MKTTLEKIAEKHEDWHRIVLSFGCKESVAEDIVQEMYLMMHKYIEKGIDISYNDEINYYYIYKQLRGLFIDLHRKEKKIIKTNIDILSEFIDEQGETKQVDVCGAMKQMDNLLDKTFWYDRTVFEIVSDGMPIAELARKTNISYYSLYNTYKNVKQLIKNNIEWD